MSQLPLFISLSVAAGLVFAYLTGQVAAKSGRSPHWWSLWGLLFGPFALIYVVLIPRKPVCWNCHARIKPLIGLCPRCLNHIENPVERQKISD